MYIYCTIHTYARIHAEPQKLLGYYGPIVAYTKIPQAIYIYERERKELRAWAYTHLRNVCGMNGGFVQSARKWAFIYT